MDSNKDQNPVSTLLGDEFSASKILARDSSVGLSSRTYYRSTTNEGVPFQWEMQPGTPKNPPLEEVVPPPTPPPAVQSMALPRPNIAVHDKNSRPSRFWFWFWSKSKKRQDSPRKVQKGYRERDNTVNNSDGDSDREFTGWVHRDSKSSLFSSTSSSNGIIGCEKPVPRLKKDVPFCCSPWNTRAVLVWISNKGLIRN